MIISLQAIIQLFDIMGAFLRSAKYKKPQQLEQKSNQRPTQPQNKPYSEQQKNVEVLRYNHLSKPQRKPSPPKQGVLTFKTSVQISKHPIDKLSPQMSALEGDRWIIDPQIIEHYRINNIFYMIQESPAVALQLTLVRQATSLIHNPQQLQIERENANNQEISQKSPQTQYAIIYADLFCIKYSFLRKIKLKGPDKKSQGAILSLQPIAKIYAPLLEELTANDHPITNVRFLRKCIWPHLSKLSLKNNSIADSIEIARILPTISNVQHIEGMDLDGEFSKNWTQIGWVCKMGFGDAKKEVQKLERDEEYRYRYANKVLRRIDCSMYEKRLGKAHIQMIANKFNNPYFDNPISIW